MSKESAIVDDKSLEITAILRGCQKFLGRDNLASNATKVGKLDLSRSEISGDTDPLMELG